MVALGAKEPEKKNRKMDYSTSSVCKDRYCKADTTLRLCVHFLQITVKRKDKAGNCVWLDLYQLPDVLT